MCSSVNVEQDLPNSSPETEGTVCWHLHLPAACDFFEYLLDVILGHSSESYSSSASELVIFPISKSAPHLLCNINISMERAPAERREDYHSSRLLNLLANGVATRLGLVISGTDVFPLQTVS
ncbi:hypothetical protein PISMIDRAFT_686090 [Pisolithus microcarpus 441]|uniref:Uncharacterized protein n=1 Tax=Pisolithus microcarpus 441 TaxID=765257 RepID=A0A0C9YS21_9AGAM|nr:hypothetical protein PISMIDRAFT_686090 [Pisolithus microcarpus 441]